MGHLSLLFPIILLCLLFQFPFSCSLSSCLPDQSSALLQFKASFSYYFSGGCRDYGQQDYTATWENGTDCCSWLGVTCDHISGHVIGLDLSCGGLQGELHPNSSLFHLTHLHTLNLAWNDFSYFPPPSQLGSLVSLTHLNLSGTDLKGEIPSHISHLSKLASLDLSDNPFLKWKEATWRRLVQNATSLRELVLDYTDMSSIRLVNLSSSLVTLSLPYTGLQGEIPPSLFSNLSHLTFMSLFFNNINGSIPSSLLTLPSLTFLDLSHNDGLKWKESSWRRLVQNATSLRELVLDFTDMSSIRLVNLSSSLVTLSLQNTGLQGEIPPSLFSNLSHLTSLDLSGNNINGSIPSSLLTLPSLTYLHLSSNHLSGEIPDVFPQSNRFRELYLGENNIGGVLPSSLSNLHHLIFLDLYSNNFRGQISSWLFDLTQLSELDYSDNKLQGPLPNKITEFSNLTVLRLGNNLLNGTIPSWCLSLVELVLSSNQFTGHIGAISSYSLVSLVLSNNKLEGNIPESIFSLTNLTYLVLSSNNLSGHLNFQLLSKLQNLEQLSLSHNSQLSLDFKSDANYSFPNLQELDLSSLNLTGIPKLSVTFPHLVYLYLSNNQLAGRVPDNWLHEMDSLRFLNLSQNLLTSTIDLFSTNSLQYLDLSFNLLAGNISLSICNATSLQALLLSHNNFTGTIPQCLGNFPSLQLLDLQMNNLHGTLPSNFPNYNWLSSINLNGNNLQGPLPKSLSHCMNLEFLDLGNNQIEDTFPHWLQTLPDLKVLVLRGNKFQGHIVALKTKHSFPSLMIFDISGNNFSGPIPKAYIKKFEAMKNVVVREEVDGSMKYMEVSAYISYILTVTVTIKDNSIVYSKIPTIFAFIDLSENIFEGEIPYVIGQLHALKGLNLSHNRLTGRIPQSMGNLENLESLDLSSNMLTGGIPAELTNTNSLEVLHLSHNHLVGEIPQGKQFNTFPNDSYEGNLGLCGFPLSKKCHMDPEQHSSPSQTLWKEDKFEFGWKPVAIGYGCGMVFGVGLGCCVFSTGKPQWLVRKFGGQPNKKMKTMRKRRTHGTMNQLVQMS